MKQLNNLTTLELWPAEAKNIITSKNIKHLNHFKNIIYPWDSNYDQQRQMFSIAIQERPLFIIIAMSELEVLETLNLIKKYNLSMRIVGGRHSTLLQNPEVFLVMRQFNNIKLDKYLHVGAGLTQGEVNEYLFKKSEHYHFVGIKPNHPTTLALSTGSASSVGIAGISTVGGIGILRRTYGLTIDSIKCFRVAIPPTETQQGRIVEASSKNHPDLYWCLKGGNASNFGIVLSITYIIHKINKIIQYEVAWPYNMASSVIDIWQKTSPSRPFNYNEDLSVFNDRGVKTIHLTGFYVKGDNEKYKDAYKSIANQLESLNGLVTIHPSTSYGKVYNNLVNSRAYHNFYNAKTILTNHSANSQDVINLIDRAGTHDGIAYIGFQLMGGMIAKVPFYETAYYARDAKFFMDLFVFYDNVIDQQFYQQLNDTMFDVLYKQQGPYVYLGFPIPFLNNHLHAYYGKNKERLMRIKKVYDPLNLLVYPGSL